MRTPLLVKCPISVNTYNPEDSMSSSLHLSFYASMHPLPQLEWTQQRAGDGHERQTWIAIVVEWTTSRFLKEANVPCIGPPTIITCIPLASESVQPWDVNETQQNKACWEPVHWKTQMKYRSRRRRGRTAFIKRGKAWRETLVHTTISILHRPV